MQILPKLLIIGGTGRNLGKTTLAISIIKKFSSQRLIGLKVSAHRKGEESFHGSHLISPAEDYNIQKEKLQSPWKDTAKMVSQGAEEAFYIEASNDKVSEAFNEFMMQNNPKNLPIVCESKSMIKHCTPGVFILLTNKTYNIPEFEKEKADVIYYYEDGLENLQELCNRIHLSDEGWSIDLQ